MVRNIFMKSRTVMRLLSMAVICTFLSNGMAWGALQAPLSKIPVPKPPNLAAFVKDEAAAIRLGKALFWDMQAGSDGVTACATCHYRAGADPVLGTAPKLLAKRDKNQLHPGPDTIFGNNSTVIKTFVQGGPVITGTLLPVPVIMLATGFPLFVPNYTLQTFDFPLFSVILPTARLVIDPLTGLTSDAVISLRDTNDVVGSQGVRLAQFTGIDPNANTALDFSTPLTDTLFTLGGGINIRQVTGRNSPSVINAVFNFTNFWDGRANNIFNGVSPFGPLDQAARIWVNTSVPGAQPVQQQIAIPNASLASQAVGPPLNIVEMSFKDRTFPELGRKMLSRAPLATQFVHPLDSVLGALSRDPNGDKTGSPGISVPGPGNNTYRTMIEAAFVDKYWNAASPPGGFTQIEANFSLFWGLAIQLYEATLVSDRTPFDRFQLGNQNALSPDQVNFPNIPSAVRGFGLFDSKCAVCHSGSEFSSAVVGSNNCLATTRVIDPNACNAVAFTNNSSHNLIKQAVPIPEAGAPTPPPPSLFDAGFFNIGVRPTADDPGRGGSAPSGLPLSFSQLAVQAAQAGLPFVTPKLPAGFTAIDKVQGSFKTPGLRNVELTAPYFHNGDALDLVQVVEFYSRGGNFPGNPELAINMQPLNFRNDPFKRADLVAFLKTLTDERVRNETAPFDHPQLMIPNGVDANGADLPLIILDATGGAAPDIAIQTLTIELVTSPTDLITPVASPTNLTTLVISGTVDDTATVAVGVTNPTGVSLPTAVATVGGTVGGVVGGVAQLAGKWSIILRGLTPGLNTITVTATSISGSTKFADASLASKSATIQITPTAIISGAPSGDGTKQNSATLTIAGVGVKTYQYSFDGGPFHADPPNADNLVSTPIILNSLADGPHTVAVLAKDADGNQQSIASTATWRVKANPPVLTIDPFAETTNKTSLTIGGTVELSPTTPTVAVAPPATAGIVRTIDIGGIATWSCDITGLVPGTNNITVTMLDFVFNQTTRTGVITVVVPDGNMKGTGTVDVSDALRALRIAVGVVEPTSDDQLRGDVAPLVNGKPAPDDIINMADAIVILKKVVGLVTF